MAVLLRLVADQVFKARGPCRQGKGPIKLLRRGGCVVKTRGLVKSLW